MNYRRLMAWLVLIAGGAFTLIGVGFCTMYVLEGVIKRLGEPDQSLVFWYLPILFMGFAAIAGGLVLVAWGRQRLKENRPQP